MTKIYISTGFNFIFRREGYKLTTLSYRSDKEEQAPLGLKFCFNLEELLRDLTPEGFKKWIRKNYKAEAVEIDYPCVCYDRYGHIPYYTYIFEERGCIYKLDKESSFVEIRVYARGELIFLGTKEEFRKWLELGEN